MLLVPVKPLAAAKSRLRGAHADHDGLVLALMQDSLAAALAAGPVVHTLVVSPDDRVARLAERAGAGACAASTGSLNADLRMAAELVGRRCTRAAIGVLPADLPALRTSDLEAAIGAAEGRRSFGPDREGTGTTLLLSGRGLPLDPRYGPASATRHIDSGAHRLVGSWSSLACDVDAPADLAAAASLGLGRRTGLLLGEPTTAAAGP